MGSSLLIHSTGLSALLETTIKVLEVGRSRDARVRKMENHWINLPGNRDTLVSAGWAAFDGASAV
jgi:hypothetical protein